MPGRISKREDTAIISDDRVSSIQLELEQLLALGDPSQGVGPEVLTDKRRKARKILYKNRTDDVKETNDDSESKKKSKRNKHNRVIKSGSGRPAKESTDGSLENEEIKRNSSNRGSKSPKPQRRSSHKDINTSGRGSKSPKLKSKGRESRKIKYNKSSEIEAAEELDRDTHSFYSKSSKGSKGTRISKRSGHRKPNRSKSTPLPTDDVDGVKDTSIKSTGKHGSKSSITIQRATGRRKAMRRRSWSFDDFSNTSWSSSEGEDDVEVGLNDEREFCLNDEGAEVSMELKKECNTQPRRFAQQDSKSSEPRRKPKASMKRSSSTGGLFGKGLVSSPRRNSKRTSGASAIDADIILGDPSRKAPPSRSKSINTSAASKLRIGGGDRRAPPTRSQSNDFADFLRNQGVLQKSKPDRPVSCKPNVDQNIVESKGEEERSNPFEVTYQSYDILDNWDPFTSDQKADEETKDSNERRGKLRVTKSGGLLQTSSKDTISRLPIGANVLATSVNSINSSISSSEPCDTSKGERDKQREKQRRAVYKKSIATAAMAGQRLPGAALRTNQRQARTIQPSFEESVKQLEFALQRAR